MRYYHKVLCKKRTHIVAIDMGMRTTKAVSLQRARTGSTCCATRFRTRPFTRRASPPNWSRSTQERDGSLGRQTRQVILIVASTIVLLRHAKWPLVPVSDMRQMLKFNSKNYLHRTSRITF